MNRGGGNTITGLVYEGKVELATYLCAFYFNYISFQKLGLQDS